MKARLSPRDGPRFSPSKIALGYIALSLLVLALFAIPLWYGYRANLATFRAYVPGAEMQRLVDIFHRDGPQAVAAAMDSYVPGMPRDEVIVFVDPDNRRLAGSLPGWPAEVPDVPGTYGLVIGAGGEAPVRVVTSHVTLSGGYRLLMGRESVRFDSLVERFWYGAAGAMALVLALGATFAWLLRRGRLSEQRYALVMDASDEGFWDWIVASDDFYASPRLLEMYGFPPGTVFAGRADFLGRLPFHPEDGAKWQQAVAAHFAAGTARFDMEIRLLRAGETRWIHLTGLATRDAAGMVVRWTGAAKDVTERKCAEEALRLSEERYALAMQASGEGHWDWKIATDEFYASPRWHEIAGFAPQEKFASRAEMLARYPFHPQDRPKYEAAVAAHFAGETPRVDMELRITPHGKLRWVKFIGMCLRDAAGAPVRWAGSVSDVTEKKNAEQALRLSEERYAHAMEGSDAGHWDWNIVTDEMFVSERAREMLALPPGALPDRRADIMALVPQHPDDQAQMGERVRLGIRAGIHERDYRVIPRPGEVRWLRTRGKVYKDARGAAVRMTGSLVDITERKLAADALRASEARYSLAMEASEEGYVDVNIDTGEFVTSERLNEIFGIAPGTRITGRSDFLSQFRFYGNDGEIYHQALREIAADGGPERYQFEFRIVLPSGEVRWIWTRGKVTRDAEGRARRRVGVFADITARKLTEGALRESEERYERAMLAAEAGFWDWDVARDKYYVSPRLLEMAGLPAGTTIAGRADFQTRVPLHPDDLAKWQQAIKALFASGGSRLSTELRVILGTETRWYRLDGMCFRDAAGNVTRWIGSSIDVTARKLAEERYALAMEASEEGHFDWNVQTDEIFVSAHIKKVFGFPVDAEFRMRNDLIARIPYHPDDWTWLQKMMRDTLAGQALRHEFEYRILRDGQVRWLHAHWKILRDAAGQALRVIGVVTDVNERRHAANALKRSEERFALAVAGSNDGLWDWDILTNEMFLSERAQRIYGLEPGHTIRPRAEWRSLVKIHPDDAEGQLRNVEDYLAGKSANYEGEWRVLHPDGRYRWIRIRGTCVRDADGRPTRFAGSVSDIDERRCAEEALRRSESYLTEALRLGRAGSFAYDARAHQQVHWSPTTYEILDFDPAGGLPAPEEVYRRVHPEDVERVREARGNAISGKADYDAHYRIVRRDGTIRHLHATGHPARDANGEVVELVGVVTDVTERKRAEQELRDSEQRFRALTELSSDWYWRQDENLRFTYVSHQVADSGKYPREWVIGKARWELPGVTPLSAGWDEHQAVLAARQPFREFEYARLGRGGQPEYVSVSGAPIFDEQGNFRGYQGVGRSITERKRAEEEMKALERKLRQAQRLEAMGTLAGGIAHDFNNILGAILGYGEMALRDAAKGSRLQRDLDSIMAAGERGRALVDRVLAFSRSAVGERVAVHVEKVVREALDLLSAKLPPNVTLHAKLHAGPAAMLGDATQVHQVLMNLATNAIQAMPGGGTLRVSLDAVHIEAARAPTIGTLAPGEYLVLQVADTGTGIAPEIVDRIFDPFFTTKDVGTGTGLGLSLVHGIVGELGGAIDVVSTPGAGSTFTVYLPRSGDALDSSHIAEPELPRGDGQRVLVVDDEEPLVRLATRTLEELGYVATGFTSSAAALSAFRADPQRFDALITDERMPGMSGSALIREVRGIRDRIPVVLMSGFVGAAVTSRARAAGAEEVLKKPLSARDLAASLARVLQA